MAGKLREAAADSVAMLKSVVSLPTRADARTAAGFGHAIPRNPGMALDLGFLESMRNVNRSALERRVASLTKRRSIKADNQAAWLLRALVMQYVSLAFVGAYSALYRGYATEGTRAAGAVAVRTMGAEAG